MLISAERQTCGATRIYTGITYICRKKLGHEGKCSDWQRPLGIIAEWTRGPLEARQASKEEHKTFEGGRRLCERKDECTYCEAHKE